MQRLMTRANGEAAYERSSVPTIANAELWRGMGDAPTVVLFVDGPPGPRDADDRTNEWEWLY